MTNCLMVKVCVLGMSSVGKSSIAVRFVQDCFNHDMPPTLGAAFLYRFVSAPAGTLYKLQIWDTAGQERYKSLTPMYYRGASVVLIVYDISNRETLVSGARRWVEELAEKGPSDALLVLVGNKSDLPDDVRQVEEVEARAYAETIGALFYEASAKTGQNISNIFTDVCACLEEKRNKDLTKVEETTDRAIIGAEESSAKDAGEKTPKWTFGNGRNDWNREKPTRRGVLVSPLLESKKGSNCCSTG